ncbi:MAG: hypothetical protein MZV64_52305 [Ignavibacteriales bacterium]|nr:hypothetical protein [Ignavibacteriales bacterium]
MNERILTIVNKNSNQQKLEFTLPGMYKVSKAKDLVSGKEFEVKDNKMLLDVDGSKYLILKLEK